MHENMSHFIKCLFGPRLYRLYKIENRQGKDYEGSVLEHYSDGFIRSTLFSLSLAWSLGIYASPMLSIFMYRRGYFSTEGAFSLIRLSSSLGLVMCLLFFIRGIGRMMNLDYAAFITTLNLHKQNRTRQSKLLMGSYDFDFRSWPADFYWNETVSDKKKSLKYLPKRAAGSGIANRIVNAPVDLLSYFAIHSFGRMMIYPGSVGALNALLSSTLQKGRTKLVEENQGERYKLVTEEGNEIDSMFIDRRNDPKHSNGNILVICCEGNAGFYEYGITGTPIGAGYSVLGWNHPGFASSTGMPYPDQELHAMDTVMQFALSRLGFKPEDIVIYAWSIGGFTATWAAMNYPDIKGLILDATFDDLITLAIPRMPSSWKPLVVRTIKDYMNLNNAEQLIQYRGPVLLYRRTKDEIISTIASQSIRTNRGNNLLIKFFQARYPKLVNQETLWALEDWLGSDKRQQNVLWNQHSVDEDICASVLASYINENGCDFPFLIGEHLPVELKIQIILYLADKHMLDYDSTHCIPLPHSVFHLPWELSSVSNGTATRKAHI